MQDNSIKNARYMKKLNFLKQEGRTASSRFLKMFTLLTLLLVGVNDAWGQESSTSNIYKFKGVKAERVYAYVMPYNSATHHQQGTVILNDGEKKVFFDVDGNKGLSSIGTFTNGDKISKYGNFVIRTSQNGGKLTQYRLNFHYGTGKTRHLDIIRHEEPEWNKVGDKNDGLVVISLQTPALFQSDEEVNSIYKIEIEPLNNSSFKVEACYFITMMPNFDYSDIDGNDIGNAYIHPSFLIPSNGVNIYPAGEETGNPDDDNYIIEVEATTNYFVDDNPSNPIDWHRTPRNGDENIIDSLTYTNPKLVWSMNYATPQDMTDVTYCTVDRWGDNASASHFNGNALWRWIFVHRELFNVASGDVDSTPLRDTDFSKWTTTDKDATQVPYEFDYNLNTSTQSIYGMKDIEQRGVGLHGDAYKDFQYLVVKKNVNTADPKFQFIYNDGGWGLHTVEGVSYGDDFCYVDLDALRSAYGDNLWLTSVFGDNEDVNATNVYLVDALKSGWATVNLRKSMFEGHYDGYWDNSLSTDMVYGDSNVGDGAYANLSQYANLDINVSNGVWPRLIFNRNGSEMLEIGPATVNNENVKKYISDWGNTKRIKLDKIREDYDGKSNLNAIKNPSGANILSMELVIYGALPDGKEYITVSADSYNSEKTLHLKESDYHMWDGFTDLGVPSFTAKTKSTTYQEVMYGSDDKFSYADLSDYDYMEIKVKSGEPMIVFNKQDGEGTIECHPSADSGKQYYNVINGVYTINLQKIKEDQEFVHLNSIKNWNAGGTTEFDGAVQLQKLSDDQASNYTLNDKDAIHFYNSVYNGDFTNTPYGCHGNDHANREQINYIYYQTYGNEYNQIIDGTCPDDRMPVIVDGKTIGHYVNVTADGHLVPTNQIKNIKLSIKDICLTKNKVEAQQNHANLVDLMNSKTCHLNGETQNGKVIYYGNQWESADDYADLTDYYSLRIKGTPKAEYRLQFNGNAGNDVYEAGKRFVRLDANGYAELDLRDIDRIPDGNSQAKYQVGHLYLTGIYGTTNANQSSGSIEYVRAVKDQDLNANGVHELVREDFHTWNGGVNATVTRQNANGIDFKTSDGFLKYNEWGQNLMHNYAELTGWKWMKLEGAAGTNIYITYNDESVTSENCNVKTEYVTLDSKGEAWVNIGNHQYFHLHNIGKNGEGAGSLSHVYLVPDPRVDYVLRGNGVLSEDAAKALLDPTACVIDARPRVNNKQTIDLYTEQVYDANPSVWNLAKCIGLSDPTLVLEPSPSLGEHRARYIRMANQNCIVMVRGDFDSTQPTVGYEDITNIQYWHGIRSMHHANMAIIPADYDGSSDYNISSHGYGSNDHKVMTAGLYLVDGFPYRIPTQLRITQGNSGSYARLNSKSATEKALVNTICVPFTVTLATKSGDSNSIYASSYDPETKKEAERFTLNNENTRCQFYKITDLVHNTTHVTNTAGLLVQDEVDEDDYVFNFRPVSTLKAYHPYVFVNKYNDQLREGTRMEVYTGQPGDHNDVYPTVAPDGTLCQAMNNASDKEKNTPEEDDYYLRGTNAASHVRSCWYFNTQGYLVKAKYMTNNTFRAVLKSDTRSVDDPFEDAPSLIKVANVGWIDNTEEEMVSVKAIDTTNDPMVSVYSVNGILLRPSVELGNALEGLPRGIYIVNGKKAIKR